MCPVLCTTNTCFRSNGASLLFSSSVRLLSNLSIISSISNIMVSGGSRLVGGGGGVGVDLSQL